MNVFILAIDHGVQLAPGESDTPGSRAEKAKLESLVRGAISVRGVQAICEEANTQRLTIAQGIAYENRPRIPWRNIVMTAQERLEAGVYDALLGRPFHWILVDERDEERVAIEHRILEDEIREQFFVDCIVETAGACGAKDVLVLCGDMHADALKARLEAHGHRADVDHTLIPEKRWE
ncbi:MAG: hypothetical protein WAM91_17285 [Candidatus Acidiferrales bacterium]